MRLLSALARSPTSVASSGALALFLLIPFARSVILEDQGGVEVNITKVGDCTSVARKGDVIRVAYRGTLQSNGEEFDSSYGPGREPFQFKLGSGQVIKGWDVGLDEMCLGEARILVIPPAMGYGSRGAPPKIPPGAVLVFETELVGVNGVVEPEIPVLAIASKANPVFGIATAPANPPAETSKAVSEDLAVALLPPDLPVNPPPMPTQTIPPSASDLSHDDDGGDSGECELLGPFALLIQGSLGGLAILSLVYKRWRETPRRPLLIWFFDVSKQVLGSVLLHIMNVFFSMLSGGSFDVTKAVKPSAAAMMFRRDGKFVQDDSASREKPNPCSFYLLNLGIDTTIGIAILVVLLKVLHALFSYTPLANPPESLRSGNYGQPPRWRWYLKQSLIYYIALFLMKLIVAFLLKVLPWLAWAGDWALRWTEGNQALQIAFSMLIFPLIMNCIQYWIIDSFIKDPAGGSSEWQGHERVPQDEDHEGRHEGDQDAEDDDDDDATVAEQEEEDAKGGKKALKEANPTPVPAYTDADSQDRSGGSSGSSGSSRRGSRRGISHDKDD